MFHMQTKGMAHCNQWRLKSNSTNYWIYTFELIQFDLTNVPVPICYLEGPWKKGIANIVGWYGWELWVYLSCFDMASINVLWHCMLHC